MATTLKLPPQLKDRVASVIEGTGKSAHAFMVEAIEEQTALAERRKAFVSAAVSARRDFRRTRKGYALEDARREVPASERASERANRDSSGGASSPRSEEHTSELQSRLHLVCRLLLEKKKKDKKCRR